jgi:hypothetical protein
VFNAFNAPPVDMVAIPPLQSGDLVKGFEAEMPALSATVGEGLLDPVSVTEDAYSTCTTTSYGIEDDPRLRLFEEL